MSQPPSTEMSNPIQDFYSEFSRYTNVPIVNTSGGDLAAWFRAADTEAMTLQEVLAARQQRSLWITLFAIGLLALSAVLLHNPVPQLLCPVAVFFMILYFERVRKERIVFRFTTLRLLSENLRIVIAAQGKPELLSYIFSQRRHSVHAVVHLTKLACKACEAYLTSKSRSLGDDGTNEPWEQWKSEQGRYFGIASEREKRRSKLGKYTFNAAFSAVGLIALGLGFWTFWFPDAMSSDLFRFALALAAGMGSMGLAYINYVRERKAFDQSLDYAHMNRILNDMAAKATPATSDVEILVASEAMEEQGRWAVRMAGHF